MDWARAKNIILIVLIILNLFLFVNVMNVKDTFVLTGQYQKNARQALETAGVVVTGNIPSYNKPIGRISYMDCDTGMYRDMIKGLTGLKDDSAVNPLNRQWDVNGKALFIEGDRFVYTDGTGTTVLPVEDEKRLDRKLLSWIRDKKISKERFVLDNVYKDDDTIIAEYIQQYKDLLIYNNRITFTIKNGRLSKAEGNMKLFDTIKLSKADEIISANIVLLTGKSRIRGVINTIDLGYMQLQEEDLYDTPVWRVTLISGDRVFYNAYTGEWIEFD